MIDENIFRKYLGLFTTGVTVITSRSLDEHDEQSFHGLTSNSFNSVSISPPLVLFSLKINSSTGAAIKKSEKFAVSILNYQQQSISKHFSMKKTNKFDDFHDFHLAKNGCPLINDANLWLEGEIFAVYPGGDHEIYVGRITDAKQNNDLSPLVYYKGDYANIK